MQRWIRRGHDIDAGQAAPQPGDPPPAQAGTAGVQLPNRPQPPQPLDGRRDPLVVQASAGEDGRGARASPGRSARPVAAGTPAGASRPGGTNRSAPPGRARPPGRPARRRAPWRVSARRASRATQARIKDAHRTITRRNLSPIRYCHFIGAESAVCGIDSRMVALAIRGIYHLPQRVGTPQICLTRRYSSQPAED